MAKVHNDSAPNTSINKPLFNELPLAGVICDLLLACLLALLIRVKVFRSDYVMLTKLDWPRIGGLPGKFSGYYDPVIRTTLI